MTLIDTHAHLDYPDFETDFDEVLARARTAGVERILTIGTSIEGSRRAVALADKYPAIYAVIGVHPTSLPAENDIMTPLRELARHPKVAAIGETGLDYHHLPSSLHVERLTSARGSLGAFTGEDTSEIEDVIEDGSVKSSQAAFFEEQLDLAAELGLNVVIHQRDAWEDTLEIIRPYSGKLRAVFHCFGNSIEDAAQLFRLGHCISFTGIVTFKNAKLAQDTAAKAPADSFMVETDCPYLAPEPFRGKRCEPAHVREVAEKIAQLRGESFDSLARQTTANADRFFRFNPAS